jgi:hypothetical protein
MSNMPQNPPPDPSAPPVTPPAEQVQISQDALSKHLDTLKAELPENVRELLGKRTLEEQLTWLTDNKNLLIHRPEGVPPTPAPAKDRDAVDIENKRRKASEFYKNTF